MSKRYQTKEIWCSREGMRIFGTAYIPEGAGPFPTVLVAHGFGGTWWDNENYARQFAGAGITSYLFDFCGGSPDTKSDGRTTDMSVMTELKDLDAVLEQCRTWDFVDRDRLFLLGESQGGFVAALSAAHQPELKGLILLYPAFMIADNAKAALANGDAIPERFSVWEVPLGSRYYTDLLNLDVYGEVRKYNGPVLIFHGTRDDIVPLSYSERAVEVYGNAALELVDGAGHGFYGEESIKPGERMIEFIHANQ